MVHQRTIKSEQFSVRIQSLDALKFFAIFLVLWGHCIQYLIPGNFWDKPLYRIIYSFHMPLFMALSGFFFVMTLKDGYIKLIKKRFIQLLLPVLSWGLIYSALTGGGYFEVLMKDFWFLKSAFVCCLLGYWVFIQQQCKWTVAALIATIVFSVAFPYYQLDFMYPFFLIGGFMRLIHGEFSIRNYKIILVFSGVIFTGCLLFLDSATYQIFRSNFGSWRVIITEPVHTLIIRFYRIMMALVGILFFYSAFEIIFANPPKRKINYLISEWGRYTLGIYILQVFLLETFLKKYLVFTNLNPWLFNLVVAPVISLIVMILCVVLIKLIQTNRYLSFMLLGQPLHKHALALKR